MTHTIPFRLITDELGRKTVEFDQLVPTAGGGPATVVPLRLESWKPPLPHILHFMEMYTALEKDCYQWQVRAQTAEAELKQVQATRTKARKEAV